MADWELREYLLYRHGHQCAYCRGLSGDPVLEREHVVPRGKGGSNRVSNQVIACKTCNQDKGCLLPEAWLEGCRKSRKAIDRKRAETLPDVIAGKRPSLGNGPEITFLFRYSRNRHSHEGGNPPRTVDPRLRGDDVVSW